MNIFDLLASLSQALATLFAVFLAFLFSILSDKSSWKQRKKEQIRDHQIDSIKTLVQLMQKTSFFINDIINIKQQTNAQTLEDEDMGSRNRNIIASGNSQIKKRLEELQEMRIQFLNELWELRFLRFGKFQITKIEEYLEEYDNLINRFRVNENYIENNYIDSQSCRRIMKLFEEFIEMGEDGLTK
jgi:hypothetical protein